MVILYFVRWFNIILVLRFLFQPGRLCTKLGFFVYYYLPYCYLHQTQENENVRSIKEGKIILKIALRLWSYVLDFLFSNPIVWSYIFRRIFITLLYLIGAHIQAKRKKIQMAKHHQVVTVGESWLWKIQRSYFIHLNEYCWTDELILMNYWNVCLVL